MMYRNLAAILLVSTIMLCATERSWADARNTVITILHTNDLHGYVMPRGEIGGLARIATLIRQIRSDMPNVLLLDAGDIIHGSMEDYLSGGIATITAMNAVDYQVVAFGNHDLDLGQTIAKNAIAAARFPFLAANMHDANGCRWDGVSPCHILVVDGVRVGVFGLASLETGTLHWPSMMCGIVIDDPIQTAQTLVPELKAKCDVLIALSHLGAAEDAILAEQVPGIDFIVGGHSHNAILDWRWVGNTLVTQAGAYGRALGRIDFVITNDDTGVHITSVNGKNGTWNDPAKAPLGKVYPELPLIPIDNSIAEDEAVRAAYMPFREKADKKLAEVIGNSQQALPGRSAGAFESSAGDFVADAVRSTANSDIAVIDDVGSVSKNGLPAGVLNLGSAYGLISGFTRQEIVACQMSACDLTKALNSDFAKKKSINLAISGASLKCKSVGSVPVISQICIDGEPVDPCRMVTVASQSYVMMDMMAVVPGITVVSEPTSTTTREAIAQYITKLCEVVPVACDRIICEQ
ncbi:metallophosphoesterase [bacterium]|nr:metallophosphoesterase [bacterium]